jgi:nitrogen regulatory protein P-II 1
MKRIEAIVRPTGVKQVCNMLEKVGYPGVTISNVEGHGRQKGFREVNVRGKMCKMPFIDKKRIMLVVHDNDADRIIKAIREAACTGKMGDGKIFVSPMDDAIRISTGETGDVAV